MEYSDVYGEAVDKELLGHINLSLAVVIKACVEGDKEWLLGAREGPTIAFDKIITLIPDKLIQKALGIGLIDMTTPQIARQLIKKIDIGYFKNMDTRYLWGPIRTDKGES